MIFNDDLIFRLLCFQATGQQLSQLLRHEGTIAFQFQGFPQFLKDCTCVPKGPIQFFCKAGIEDLDAQWYRKGERLEQKHIPEDIQCLPRIKDHVIHPSSFPKEKYPLHYLGLGNEQVQALYWSNKVLVYERLGHSVLVDLGAVDDLQRFTISIEWSPLHIELRVSWVENSKYKDSFSGRGVFYEELATFKQTTPKHSIIQFKSREEFDVNLMPARLAKRLWTAAESHIEQEEASNKYEPDFNTPRSLYRDPVEFVANLKECIESFKSLMERNKPDGFWNNNRPKSETEAGHVLKPFSKPY